MMREEACACDLVSRRRFLKSSAATGVFQIVPRAVLGAPEFKAPSEKLECRMGWSI